LRSYGVDKKKKKRKRHKRRKIEILREVEIAVGHRKKSSS